MNVFPEAMNKIDVNDPITAIRTIENYVNYIVERVQHSSESLLKSVQAGMTTAEVIERLTSLQLQVSSALSTVSGYSARINTLEYNTSGLSDLEDEVDEQREELSEAIGDIETLLEDVDDLKDAVLDLETDKADKAALYDLAPVITETVSGSVANFTDGAAGYPLKSLVIEIEYSQSGSGTAAPGNERPILGMLGTTIMKSGADTGNPDTISISWQTEAGIIYHGSLDVATGVMTADWAMKTFKGASSESIAWESVGHRMNAGVTDAYTNGAVRQEVISNLGTFDASAATEGVIFIDNTNGGSLYYYPPSSVTDLASLKTWLSANNLQCLYKLATPETIQITPTEIKTILGENNIWAASGDVEVEYCADTKLYIDKMISS